MKRVLFICTGNVCRSPMAAALFQDQLRRLGLDSEVEVTSRGIYALEDRSASSLAVEVLAERGIDLSEHRGQSLTEADLHDADLVVVMAEEHRRSIFYTFPQYLHKVYLLSEMRGQHFNIKDPYQQPRSEYERCLRDLDTLLTEGQSQILRRLGFPSVST